MRKVYLCLCSIILIGIFILNLKTDYFVSAYFDGDIFSTFSSDSYILIDADSDVVLASKNIYEASLLLTSIYQAGTFPFLSSS